MANISGEDAFCYMLKANEQEIKSGQSVIHTEIGELAFKIPPAIEAGIHSALQNNSTGYAHSQGLPVLRQAISSYLLKRLRVTVDPNDVIITAGAKPGITAALTAFLKAGRQVAFPNPGYPIYHAMTSYFGGSSIPLPLRNEKDFQERTKRFFNSSSTGDILIINSPHNLTGTMLSWNALKEIAELAIQKQVIVIADESYLDIVYGRQTSESMLCFPELREQLIIIQGASKMFAFTGGRIGWCVAPQSIVPRLTTFLGNIYSCCPPFIQLGVARALEELQKNNSPTSNWFTDLIQELKQRRDSLCEQLGTIPKISYQKPDGAFYLWVNITQTGLTSEQFTNQFLQEYNISVLPGNSFGSEGEGYIRICYGKLPEADITVLCIRLRDFISQL